MDKSSPGKKRKFWRGLAGTSTVLLLGMVTWQYLQPKPKVVFSDGTEVVAEKVEVFYVGEGETRWEQFCYWLGRVNKDGNVSRLVPVSSIRDWVDRNTRHYPSGDPPSWYLKVTLSSNRQESFPEPIWSLARKSSVESSQRLAARLATWMEKRFYPGRIEKVLLSDEHGCLLGTGYGMADRNEDMEIEKGAPIIYRSSRFDPSMDEFKLCFYRRGATLDGGELKEVWITNPRRLSCVFPTTGIKMLPQKIASDKDPNIEMELTSLASDPRVFVGGKEVTSEYEANVQRVSSPAEGVNEWQNSCMVNLPFWQIKLCCLPRKETKSEQVRIPSLPAPLPGTYRALDAPLPATMEAAEPLTLFGPGVYCFDDKRNVVLAAANFGNKTQAAVAQFIKDKATVSTTDPSTMGYSVDEEFKESGIFFPVSEKGMIIISRHPFIRDSRRRSQTQDESIELRLEAKELKVSSVSKEIWWVKELDGNPTDWEDSFLVVPPHGDALPPFDLTYNKRAYISDPAAVFNFTIGPVRPSDEDRHKAFHDSQQSMSGYLDWLSEHSEL